MDTNSNFSPHSLLPAPEPRTESPSCDYFYEHVAKHLIKDTVRLMSNGIGIDLNKVIELETLLDSQLQSVATELDSNPYVQQYIEQVYSKQLAAYIEDRKSKCRSADYYVKPFDPKNMTHRSYFMHLFAQQQGFSEPTDLLPGTTIPKWPANTVKKLVPQYPVLKRLLDGTLQNHTLQTQAIQQLAQDKVTVYNEKFVAQIQNPQIPKPTFNPNSTVDVPGIFAMLNIESETFSKKTGNPSFNRDELERIQREQIDPDVLHLVAQLLEFSSAAIVRNNFIAAFYKYTVDNRLYGNYKLFGAKSFRYTSNKPNMLNAPSTGSVFAKPIKKCFIPKPGFVIAAIDYSALEDRVIASLSRDTNKCGLFLEGLDGHSLSATYYYPGRVTELIGPFTDNKQASRDLKALVDSEDKAAKSVRQDSKPISFGLAYGAYPKKVAATVKIPLDEAEGIFNAYHNELFPGITDYRENYVLPTAQQDGKVHLGLGCYIFTDDPDKDIRTLNNATAQFWSVLTALSINRLHQLIDEYGLQDDIIVTSTIYDSIYMEVRNDVRIIEWLNNTLVDLMLVDFMDNQTVHNEANLELGLNWADLHEIPNNATQAQIQEVLDGFNN